MQRTKGKQDTIQKENREGRFKRNKLFEMNFEKEMQITTERIFVFTPLFLYFAGSRQKSAELNGLIIKSRTKDETFYVFSKHAHVQGTPTDNKFTHTSVYNTLIHKILRYNTLTP